MQIEPSLTVIRFAQLKVGDLFLYPYGEGATVGMKVVDPSRDGDQVLLLLGPTFPQMINGPSLLRAPSATVITFGKEFIVRLPCQPQGWSGHSPAFDIHCIAVSEQKAFLRANYDASQQGFRACFIDLEAGRVHVVPGLYHQPAPLQGSTAFALQWELMTTDPEPRSILAYPW